MTGAMAECEALWRHRSSGQPFALVYKVGLAAGLLHYLLRPYFLYTDLWWHPVALAYNQFSFLLIHKSKTVLSSLKKHPVRAGPGDVAAEPVVGRGTPGCTVQTGCDALR
jgi:hypothetical protein